MEAASWTRSVIGGLALASAAGCYSYRPYGMGGYPGMYGPTYGSPTYGGPALPPGTTFAPNGGALPQGTQILPSAPSTGAAPGSPALGPATSTPFGPSTHAWPPIAPQAASTFVPDGSQPQFDPNHPTPRATDRFVPDYRDPREAAPGGTFPPAGTGVPSGPSASAAPGGAHDFAPNHKPTAVPSAPAKPAKPATPPAQDLFQTPSGFDPNAKGQPGPFDSAHRAPAPAKGFSRPSTAAPGDFPRQVDSFYRSGNAVSGGPVLHDGRVGPIPTRDVSIVETAEGTDAPATGTVAREIAHSEPARDVRPVAAGPFAHDAAGFRWLQGVVDFDETTGTWNIIYDLVPDADDPLGGSVAFAPSPLFDGLRNDEAVRVEGQLEQAAGGRTGKPVFRVVRMTRLAPTKR